MNRARFESQYIAKHFGEALRLEEITYRDCLKWMQDNWLGDKYNDEEIQAAWIESKDLQRPFTITGNLLFYTHELSNNAKPETTGDNMSENAQLPIPKDILEPYLKSAVAASITQLMGDKGQQLILSAVQSALSAKVDPSDGSPSKYYSNSDIPFVEWLARSTIQKIALETVNSMAQDLRPDIEKAVKQSLTKSTNALSKTLVDGMIKSLSSTWSVKLTVNND